MTKPSPKQGRRTDVPWTKAEHRAADLRKDAWETLRQVAVKLKTLGGGYLLDSTYRLGYPLRVLWTLHNTRMQGGLTKEEIYKWNPPWIGVEHGAFRYAIPQLEEVRLIEAQSENKWTISANEVTQRFVQAVMEIEDITTCCQYLDRCVVTHSPERTAEDQRIEEVITRAQWDNRNRKPLPPDTEEVKAAKLAHAKMKATLFLESLSVNPPMLSVLYQIWKAGAEGLARERVYTPKRDISGWGPPRESSGQAAVIVLGPVVDLPQPSGKYRIKDEPGVHFALEHFFTPVLQASIKAWLAKNGEIKRTSSRISVGQPPEEKQASEIWCEVCSSPANLCTCKPDSTDQEPEA